MRKIPWVGLIVLIAAILRVYALASVPPSPSLDEVSLGYNAYSISKTGADEYGTRFPLLLRAYDDWRPALYIYLILPFVWLFGLNVAAVRLPSILLSLGSVYITYGIGRLLGRKFLKSDWWGIAASFLLAISPWHIYISRLGHEANLGLFLTVTPVYLLLLAIYEKKQWALLVSSVAFGVSLHSYQSQKVVIPILLILAAVCFGKTILKSIKSARLLLSLVIFLVVAWPAVRLTLSPGGIMRLRGTSAFSQDLPIFAEAREQHARAKIAGDFAGTIFTNHYVVSARIFTENYFSHLAPLWLLAGRDRENHKVPGLGLLYAWEAPLILIGLWLLFKSTVPRNVSFFLLVWILSAPLPAAITTQAPHAMRSYTMIPGLQLVGGFGLVWLLKLKQRILRILVRIAIVVAAIVGLAQFTQGYFVRFPREQSDSFQYALGQAIAYVLVHHEDYDTIIFSNRGNLYQSYMFYLFYSRYDPVSYQRLGGTVSGGYAESHVIDKYHFRPISWEKERQKAKIIYVVDIHEVPANARLLATFSNNDGKPAVALFEAQNL